MFCRSSYVHQPLMRETQRDTRTRILITYTDSGGQGEDEERGGARGTTYTDHQRRRQTGGISMKITRLIKKEEHILNQ